MSAIEIGEKAPHFTLEDVNGNRFSLTEALSRGPVIIVFFKIACPVSQFTFPFLQRLYEHYGSGHVSFVAISQDDASSTVKFCSEYGITFPTLREPEDYPVSNAYGITNVPTYYLIAPDGFVLVASV